MDATGVEPVSIVCKTIVLPLNYATFIRTKSLLEQQVPLSLPCYDFIQITTYSFITKFYKNYII